MPVPLSHPNPHQMRETGRIDKEPHIRPRRQILPLDVGEQLLLPIPGRDETPGLEIVGPVTLNVTLPESPSGRYALISCNYVPAGSPAQITVAGGGAGKVVIDGTTISRDAL